MHYTASQLEYTVPYIDGQLVIMDAARARANNDKALKCRWMRFPPSILLYICD